ncbi:MAG: 3,4-dihydroxy-2-butanone-4-phosphate synthase [Candidatus Micrarchaeia archaeon]
MENLDKAAAQLREGRMVVLYDSEKREGEADLIFHASFADPGKTETLRRDAGGMIVLAIGGEIAGELGLPFLHEMFAKNGVKNTYVRTNYADTPPYTTPVNHIRAHTGVTDDDKALAIKDFSNIFTQKDRRGYYESMFRTPGHLPICVSKGIANRRGHTELAVELARRAGLSECMVLCEMLGSGKALPKKDAQGYARRKGLVFVEGRDIAGK